MLFISLLTLIVAIPLYTYRITEQTYVRVTIITLIYSAFIAFNSFYIESIKSGISIYSGLFQITTVSQRIEIVIYIVGSLILFGAFSSSPNTFAKKDEYNSSERVKNTKFTESSHSDLSSIIISSNRSGDKDKSKGHSLTSSPSQSPKRGRRGDEFSLLIIFTSIGASFLVSSSDLVSIYLSIELQSFAVYVLATLYRNSESATAAGLKYFLLGGLSSAIVLLGTGIIYRYTGVTQIESIFNIVRSSYPLISPSSLPLIGEGRREEWGESVSFINERKNSYINFWLYSDNFSVLFGVLLITIGLLFKVAAAPFHNWAPDVYDGVPTVITSWITTMPKISIFILLLELNSGIESLPNFFESISLPSGRNRSPLERRGREQIMTVRSRASLGRHSSNNTLIWFQSQESIFKNLLLICSILSLIIGTVVGLSQYRIKRLLAFSTISHVGFILLALTIYTEESISSFLFYIFQYSITNVNVFLILLAFGYVTKNTFRNKKMKNVTNYSKAP